MIKIQSGSNTAAHPDFITPNIALQSLKERYKEKMLTNIKKKYTSFEKPIITMVGNKALCPTDIKIIDVTISTTQFNLNQYIFVATCIRFQVST